MSSACAALLANRSGNQRDTSGLRSASILAALANTRLLLLACGEIAWEAAHRLQIFTPVDGHSVAIVATLGIAVNGFSAWLLMANSRYDINLRAAFLHMALDAAVSLAVVIGGLSMTWLGWAWIDPAINLVIVLIVLLSAWSLLREALWLALNAVPAHVDLPAVRHYLLQQRGVTAYLVMPGGSPGDAFLRHVSRQLAHDFSIHYVTLQIVRRPWQDEAHSVCGAKNL